MSARGVLYLAASALGFSIMALLVKLASERYHVPTGEIVLSRAAVTLVLSYLMLRRRDLSPWGHDRMKLLGRGLVGSCALACFYSSIARLPLADATVLQNTTPLVTALLAWWLLDERVGWPTALAIACGLGGVVLVVQPGGHGADLGGTALALGGATCSAIAYVTVRQLSRTEHPLVIVFYFPLVATPLAIPWAAWDFVVPSPIELGLLVAIGVVTQMAQVFVTLGLSLERAGPATSIGYLQVCFAMIWQLVVFGQEPALGTLAGAALIITGTLVVSTRAARTAP